MTHHIVYIPGFGDRNSRRTQSRFLKRWQRYGVILHYQPVGWDDGEAFEPKRQRLLDSIDILAKPGNIVSLVGVSAGASLALSAYVAKKEKIQKVVFICGKLQNPEGVHESHFIKNPAFRESVFSAPANLQKLNDKDKAKMLTLHAYKDGLIPTKDSKIPGVRDITILGIGHIFSIFLALTVYAKSITKFLKSTEAEV